MKVIALVGALFVAMWTFAACGGDSADSTTAESAAPCSEVQTVDVPAAAEYHTNKKYTAADYPTNPPAGGPHSNSFLEAPSINPPDPNLGTAVHSLDHGAVILWPGADMTTEDEDALMATYEGLAAKDPFKPGDKYTQLAIVGNPEQEATFAMTAWGYLQECESVDQATIESFVEQYYASGPEGQAVACDSTFSPAPKVPACEQ